MNPPAERALGTPAPSSAPVITGRARYLPPDVLTNDDVAGLLGSARLSEFLASNAWCRARRPAGARPAPADLALYARFVAERLGIQTRHVVDRAALLEARPSQRGVFSSDLGAEAAAGALAAAGVAAEDLDLVVCGTSSPDSVYPGTATRIQARLGAHRAFGLDVPAACSSFLFALATARAFVASRAAGRALVVAAEAFTHGVDWTDPATACFFGDGAGAVVLESADLAEGRAGLAVLDVACWSAHSENIRTGLGGTRALVAARTLNGRRALLGPGEEGYPFFFQDGPAAYRELLPVAARVLDAVLGRNRLERADVGTYLLHQASAVMVDAVVERVVRPPSSACRVPRHLARYGNTSSAGVAIALAEEPVPPPGERACLLTFGGGYAAGAALLQSQGG